MAKTTGHFIAMLAELIELDGSLPKEFKAYVGGHFSLFEKLKMGGVGSSKLIYVSGNDVMDSAAAMSLDTNFCSMEIYPLGLVIRLYKINKLAAIALIKQEIKEIQFLTTPNNLYPYTLTINTADSGLKFAIPKSYKSSLLSFFRKPWFDLIAIHFL